MLRLCVPFVCFGVGSMPSLRLSVDGAVPCVCWHSRWVRSWLLAMTGQFHLSEFTALCQVQRIATVGGHVLTIGKTCQTPISRPHGLTVWWTLGHLMAEIGWQVWGTPANFNGFRILASLLHWRRSTEVNQTLHDVWPSPALVHYVYIFGRTCPLMEFSQVQNSLPVQVLCSPILASLLYGIPAVGISQTLQSGTRNRITTLSLLVIFNRVCHLYSEGGRHVGIVFSFENRPILFPGRRS